MKEKAGQMTCSSFCFSAFTDVRYINIFKDKAAFSPLQLNTISILSSYKYTARIFFCTLKVDMLYDENPKVLPLWLSYYI